MKSYPNLSKPITIGNVLTCIQDAYEVASRL